MFFATMFSYGMDQSAVGVTGISSCIGVFVVTPNPGMMYAVHVPYTPTATFGPKTGLDVQHQGVFRFANFVKSQTSSLGANQIKMFCAINGNQRQTLKDDIGEAAQILGLTKIEVVRIFKNLKISGGDAASVAVALLRKGDGYAMLYKQDSEVFWVKGASGGGRVRTGFYANGSQDDIMNADISGWHRAEPPNVKRSTLKIS
jgi:hypothetical protein